MTTKLEQHKIEHIQLGESLGGSNLRVVFGPSSTTDNQLCRFDGTSGLIQASSVSVDDNGNITLPALSTVDGIDVSVHDTATTGVHGAGSNTLLHTGDVDDTPVNGATTAPVSSNWAFDHDAATDAHHNPVTVAAAPLTLSTQEITFNYDTDDFQLSGNNLQINNAGVWEALGALTYEPTGFENTTDSTISFNTSTRVFSITPSVTSFDFYVRGVKFTKSTAQTVTISDTTGVHYIYFNSDGTLTDSTTEWSFNDEIAFVAFVYWRAGGSDALIMDERHGLAMDWATHSYLHYTVSTRYENGLTGTFNDDGTFTITAGIIADEDLAFSISQQTSCRILYQDGSGHWIFDSAGTSFFKETSSVIQYDDGDGTPADVDNSKFVAYWIYATNDKDYPIWSLMGQRQDSTIANAILNAIVSNMVLTDLPSQEMKLLYRVIVKRNGTNESVEDVTDYRTVSSLPIANWVPPDHGSLVGLDDDDHSIYALLAGRSGGQTLIGGTASGEDLKLQSTSNATKGTIFFGAAGNSGYDEVNDRLGIGTASPSVGFEYQNNTPTKTDDKMILQGGYLSGGSGEDYGFYQAFRLLHSNEVNIWTAARIKAVEESGYKGQLIIETNDGSASGDHTTTEAVRITGGQDVGIGLTPTYRLDVKDDVASSYVANFFNDGDNINRYGIRIQCGADAGTGVAEATYYVRCYDGDGGEVGGLREVNGAFADYDPSDERLKANISTAKINGLGVISDLELKQFSYIKNKEVNQIGFIAQNVQDAYPFAVAENEDGILSYSRGLLVPVLVKAIQELNEEVKNLKQQVDELRGKSRC